MPYNKVNTTERIVHAPAYFEVLNCEKSQYKGIYQENPVSPYPCNPPLVHLYHRPDDIYYAGDYGKQGEVKAHRWYQDGHEGRREEFCRCGKSGKLEYEGGKV